MGAEERSTKTGKKRSPSTRRTQGLKQVYMSQKPGICAERSVLVTASYKETEALPPVLRQAMAFDKVLSEIPVWIQDGEIIVSNIASMPRGAFLFPEYDDSWLKKELDTISTRKGDPWLLSAGDRDRIKGCMAYWQGRNLAAIADALTTDEVRQAEKNAFIDIRMGKQCGVGHIAPDIEGVITRGLSALIEDAKSHLNRLDLTDPEDYAKLPFLKAVVIADKAVIKWVARFAALAREKAATERDLGRKQELEQIAAICDWVPANPARSFREALQATAFVMASVQIETPGVSIGTGRLDQYFYPYYKRDVEEGTITKEQALELLECLWLKLAESNRVAGEILTFAHNGYPAWIQVPVGGQTRDGYDATNELSYLLLDVSSNMQLHEPTVSARIHKRTPDKFLMSCCEAIVAHGGGHPALFNDEVIIPSQLAYVPGMTKEDAYDYCVIGCSEISLAGKGTEGLPYHAVSLGRLLELMLQGKDPVSGSALASGPGDMLKWRNFEDMMRAFREQARMWTSVMFMQMLPLVEAHNQYRLCPYLSSLTRDCISRGISYYDGGAVYGNRAVNACIIGIATLANSLAAVRKLVFDDKAITMSQLKHALETNFDDMSTVPAGPAIRDLCLNVPKYGNDDPYVDNIAKDCLNIVVKELRRHETLPGQGYGATISPVAAHIPYGLICGATPDGRKKGTPLSDACSPSQGSDVNGPTATIKSVSNLEHINLVQGTIFNMKMHPAALQTAAGMAKWANLIRTYFDLGGWEIQFNVVSAETLRAAQAHPEDYKDLVVRVVGYSAFFIELDKVVQDDIIRRTEHGLQ
jgi:pyruvate formate-lyase/glycerol dehydratase family glycyl radical enzyme